MPMSSITLLIVDDHPVFRQGLRDVFATDDRVNVVGEASEAADAFAKALDLRPNVILMDINLPGNSGLQVTSSLQDRLPESLVVIITGYDEPEQVFHSLRAGASGFCSKDVPPETLIQTIHDVVNGRIVIQGRALTRHEADEWIQKHRERYGKESVGESGAAGTRLTPREMEILEMICLGAPNNEIARRLGISYQTVKNHVTAILHKLDVHDRTQAALYAIRQEWFDLERESEYFIGDSLSEE